MPLTILHISTRLILGGSQENTVLSCEGQARLGRRVHLAFGPIYGPEGSLRERVEGFNARCASGEERAEPIVMHELPNLVRQVDPVKDHFCFHRDLKGLLREVRPDVVHTHSSKAGILGRWAGWVFGERRGEVEAGEKSGEVLGPSSGPSAAAFSGGEKVGRPAVIHTIHGPPFMPVEGDAIRRAKIRATNRAYTLAERFAAARCHTIVSVADAMTEQFLARGIGRAEQYVTVRSGMEVEPFLSPRAGEDRASVRAGLGIGAGDFVVGTVARLAQHKGHDDLLDALGDELRARPDWKLLWVGDGWWRERLLGRVESMGLRDRVITTGLVPQDRVPAMMRAMDVLAHPSYREGLPRTAPQALLCGVAPVAHDVDGTREICIDATVDPEHGTGRLVRPGDHAGLREAVLWMHEDPARRASVAARGRELVIREYSAERMVERLESVYERALEAARG